VALLNITKPHLQSIKNKLGATNSYYLKLSTKIISNALHNVVEEVNAVQNDPQIELRMQLGMRLDSTSMLKIKDVFREAWKATLIMDDFDLEPSFISHYNENRNTLKTMCNQLGISTYVSRPSTISRPSPKLSASTSSTRNSAQSRPSTAHSSSSGSSSSSDENYGCIVWIFVALIVGAIGAAMAQGIGGFIIGILIVVGIWGKIQD
jgi:hypothetical protein